MITGGTSGIGLATAKALGQSGYSVIINGTDEKKGKKAVKKLQDLEIDVDLYLYDVSDEEAVTESFNKIKSNYDKIDVLVNNAGALVGRSPFEGMDTDFYRKVMAVNLDSVFFNSRAAIDLLKKSDYPSIINLTSVAGWNGGGPGAGVYGIAKAAVTTLTRALAKELSKHDIRVNAVSPGLIDTDFHVATSRELLDSWTAGILLKRSGKAEETASVIEFLASEKASYITGEVIQVNGGQTFI